VHIEACLASLAAQSLWAGEIIVVDNGSTDDTAKLVQNYASQHPAANIRLISEPKPGRGTARAAGFMAAHGHLLLSTDADTTVPPHWVATLTSTLADPKLAAATGSCQILDCPPLTNWAFNISQPLLMAAYRFVMGHWWLTGSSFGVKRAAYDASGGFDPSCRDLEDIELGWRLYRVGRIKYVPVRKVVVTTNGDPVFSGASSGDYGRTSRHILAAFGCGKVTAWPAKIS
jgi:glycosyltransferase involved in cell wall biosynthesis